MIKNDLKERPFSGLSTEVYAMNVLVRKLLYLQYKLLSPFPQPFKSLDD